MSFEQHYFNSWGDLNFFDIFPHTEDGRKITILNLEIKNHLISDLKFQTDSLYIEEAMETLSKIKSNLREIINLKRKNGRDSAKEDEFLIDIEYIFLYSKSTG